MACADCGMERGASASDETACIDEPLDIIEEMNRQFDDAIITTDVGQHMMLVSQYAEITEKKQLVMSGGWGRWDMDSRRRSEHRSVIRRNE